MGIFRIKDNKVIIDPILLTIPEFKSIWERDTTKDKSIAEQELLYTFFMSEQKKDSNPYIDYSESTKSESIIKDHVKIKDWKPDGLVIRAIEKNIEFQERGNGSLRMLNSLKKSRENLINFFNNLDIEQTDDKGKPIYKPAEILKAMKEAEGAISTIEALEEKVKREDITKKGRGQKNIKASEFED